MISIKNGKLKRLFALLVMCLFVFSITGVGVLAGKGSGSDEGSAQAGGIIAAAVGGGWVGGKAGAIIGSAGGPVGTIMGFGIGLIGGLLGGTIAGVVAVTQCEEELESWSPYNSDYNNGIIDGMYTCGDGDVREDELDTDSYKIEPYESRYTGHLKYCCGFGDPDCDTDDAVDCDVPLDFYTDNCDETSKNERGYCYSGECSEHWATDVCGSGEVLYECFIRGCSGCSEVGEYLNFAQINCSDDGESCWNGACRDLSYFNTKILKPNDVRNHVPLTVGFPNFYWSWKYVINFDPVDPLDAITVKALYDEEELADRVKGSFYKRGSDLTSSNLGSTVLFESSTVYSGITKFRTNVFAKQDTSLTITLNGSGNTPNASEAYLVITYENQTLDATNKIIESYDPVQSGDQWLFNNVKFFEGGVSTIDLYFRYKGGPETDKEAPTNDNLSEMSFTLELPSAFSNYFQWLNTESFDESTATAAAGYENSCADLTDNDNDGFIDIHDSDCGVVNSDPIGLGDYCGDEPGKDPSRFTDIGLVRKFDASDYLCMMKSADPSPGGGLPWTAYWYIGSDGDVVAINNDTTEDNRYDVVNYGGKWRACNKDGQLGNYASGISLPFNDYLDQFICYDHPDGSERIETCSDISDRLLEVEGVWLSNVESTLFFSQSQKQYSLIVDESMRSFSGFDFLEFDVQFINHDDLNVNVAGKDFAVKQYTTSASKMDTWLHVLIPLAGISNVEEIYFHTPTAKAADPTQADVRNTFFLHKPGVNQYCAISKGSVLRWIEDLDGDIGLLGDAAGSSCNGNSEAFKWTGDACCGDDSHEYFGDDLLGCWDSGSVENDSLTDQSNFMFLIKEDPCADCLGKFYECGTNEKPAALKENQHEKSDYCENVGSFFCNYNNSWDGAAFGNLTINSSSSLPDNSESGCCPQYYCYDGEGCVATQIFDPENEPFEFDGEDYVCNFGVWSVAILKTTWDLAEQGYCPNASDCLVNPQGRGGFYNLTSYYDNLNTPGGWPACIADQQFVGDHYCDNGKWSSRTKFIANALLNITDDDFSLHCDVPERALNYFDAELADITAFNNFCVLQQGSQVVVGTSVNPSDNLENSLNNAFNISGFNRLCAGAFNNEEGFEDCQSDQLWFNNKTQVVVYSNEGVSGLKGTFLGTLYNVLLRPILNLIGLAQPSQIVYGNLEFINETGDFNQIFMKTSGNKTLRGIIEAKADDSGVVYDYISAQFFGFNDSVCDSVYAFDWFRANPGRIDVLCDNSTNEVMFVVRQGYPGLNELRIEQLWVESMPSSRFEDE